MLRATTEWYVQEKIQLEIPGYEVQVFAMDSSFLHARTLFEFFTKKLGNKSTNYYGCKDYLGTDIPSKLYTDHWITPLHSHLMHAQERTSTAKLPSFDGSASKALNKMPVDFAKEVVRLWREFEKLLGNHSDSQIKALEQDAKKILSDAINNAKKVLSFEMKKDGEKVERSEMVKKYNVQPINW